MEPDMELLPAGARPGLQARHLSLLLLLELEFPQRPVTVHPQQAAPAGDVRVQLLQQLLGRQLLPVLLVLADDGDLPLVDEQPILILSVPDSLHVLVDVGVSQAVVPLEAGHQDLVGSRLTGSVAEVSHPMVLHQDLIKEGEIRPLAVSLTAQAGQFVFDLGYQHLQSSSESDQLGK